MTQQAPVTDHAASRAPTRMIDLVCRLGSVFSILRSSRYPRLDLDSMPAHLQRDLGFQDGRDLRYERAETR